MNLKKIAFLIISSFIIINAYGQNKQVDFGIKGGVNFSTNGGDIGFLFGGFTEFNFNEKLSLRPELLFSAQNMDYEFLNENPEANGPYTGNIKEKSILLPITLNYELVNNFQIALGPQFGYTLSQDIENDSDSFSLRADDWDSFEFGITSGISYDISDNYGIDIRYTYGINKRFGFNSSILQLSFEYKF